MKKSLVVFLLCFFAIVGSFSGYWVYKNSFHNLSLPKDQEHKIPLSEARSLNQNIGSKNIQSWSDQDSWERFSNPSSQVTHSDDLNPDISKSKKPMSHTQKLATSNNRSVRQKPKMAIIMDDMAYPSQLASLHRLNLKITPSFFPYNADNKLTPKMASKEPFYMVHLPLEALYFYQSPHRWIKVGEDKSEIRKYIQQIRQDFPHLKFINNHTGSKFTASYEDMKNLIEVLREYDIDFVDSRTTTQTKAGEIYAQIKRPLLSRGVFLDNKDNVEDIVNQIQKSINKAKRDGYVIVICHPHKKTFEALEIAKKSLLSQVDLVYIKDIYKMVSNEK